LTHFFKSQLLLLTQILKLSKPGTTLSFFKAVLLSGAHEGVLLGVRLEASVTEFGRGVNELKIDLLESSSLSVGQQRLSERYNTLLRANHAALQH